jgi:exosome complex RNA-binding protein Rrp42 (RNase PH superfamily)
MRGIIEMVDESSKKKTARRVFDLSRQDIYFIIIILMVAVNMAFTYSLIDPTLQLQENQYRIAYVGVAQNERILDILTNGTDDTTQDVINKLKKMDITQANHLLEDLIKNE